MFSWPPVHAVWPNYEVVMFQPWSVNDTSLGSVTNVNVLSYNPVPPSLFSGYFPFILHVLTPIPIIHPDTELRRSFVPNFPPSFRSGTAWPNKLTSRRPPPSVLHLLSCRPLPATQVPVIPWIPAPQARFFCLVPCPVAPLSLTLTSLAPLSTPVGYPFLVTFFFFQFSNHPPPPAGIDHQLYYIKSFIKLPSWYIFGPSIHLRPLHGTYQHHLRHTLICHWWYHTHSRFS